MNKLALEILEGKYVVAKYNLDINSEELIRDIEGFYSLTKTDEELSLVCKEEDYKFETENIEKDWKIFRIKESLDFSLIGILSEISSILAEKKISIFVVSTFNTDYILVKEKSYQKAIDSLCGKFNILNYDEK